MKNIVVLISGSGSNLQAIIDACGRKQINGTLRAVFSNKADAFGLERARLAGIPAHALAQSQFADREAFDRQLMHEIDAYAPDLVVLAGYMRILSPAFVSHYQGRLLNIHPSLLPKYPGLHTHRQVLENGEVTARVQAQEHAIYPLVISWFVDGRLRMAGNHAWLDERQLPPQGYAADE